MHTACLEAQMMKVNTCKTEKERDNNNVEKLIGLTFLETN